MDKYEKTKEGDNCETCQDFKGWFNETKQNVPNDKENSLKRVKTDQETHIRGKPLYRNEIGRIAWSYLHTMAAYYPKQPTELEKTSMKSFIETFAMFFPCKSCAEDFKDEIVNSPPRVENNHELSQWFCEQHNIVNRKLGKKEFDCSKVFERWKLPKST